MSLGNTALIEMMCDVCELEKATVMCGDCAGSYCDDCDGDVHQGSKATHKRESLGSQKKDTSKDENEIMKVKGNPNPKAEAEKHKTEEARSELKSKKEYSSDIQVKQEVKSEAKGEPKSESKKTEPKSEQKSEPKPEPKSEPKANTKSEGFNHGLSDSDDDFKVQSAKDPVGKTKADTSTKDEVGGEDQESGASAKNASNDIVNDARL
mmetsp:Transcript_969/g.1839  ORF Transcript_969/g.1839 Transcript_969/m.1839 type:complete len:208 (+) Transcript_969:39-662(+)